MTTFSDRLNLLMEEKGTTTAALAKVLGLSYQAVRKAREGGGMGRENSDKAAEFYSVNRDWLYSGKGKRDDLYGAIAKFDINDESSYPTEIKMLAKTFSLIPENDQKSRTLAYNAAAAAIIQYVKKD